MTNYGKVTPQILKTLEQIAGENNVLTDAVDLDGYARDETPLAGKYLPQVVVKPTSTAVVAQLLVLANQHRIPVTPRGAGSGVSGGSTPLCGGISLSLEKMNHILEIDNANFAAVVEAGVTLAQLRAKLENSGLAYPLYPGELNATIGGNVNTNAGGMNAVKYGVTRHHVLGLEAVLANGSIINCGGKFVKCSTAYDLTQLITGSEGTLAVVTRVILKLATPQLSREVLLVPFTSLQNAIDAVPDILRLPTIPVGLEFMEKSIIDIVERFTGWQMPHHEYAAFLMVVMEGETPDALLDYFRQINEIGCRHGAVEGMMPASERAKHRLLEMREKFYSAIKAYAQIDLIDTVVPRSEIARFMAKVQLISQKYNVPVIGYGHAGDGNVHLHPLCRDMSAAEWQARLPEMTKEIIKACVEMGGSISGEHGLGFVKKDYLGLQISAAQLQLMKQIKTAFDPNYILNPGKIFN